MTRHLLLVAVLGLGGCGWFGGGETEETEVKTPRLNNDESARELADIAKAFKKSPKDGEAALETAGMTKAEFDKALFNVAMPPKAAEAYANAMGR
jgi:hypothetical protein